MAKFVLTTWAACLARQKPVSTSAKPACMKITRTAPRTTQSRLTCWPSDGDGVGLLGAGDGGEREQGGGRHAEARRGPSGWSVPCRASGSEDEGTCSVPFGDVEVGAGRRCLTCS